MRVLTRPLRSRHDSLKFAVPGSDVRYVERSYLIPDRFSMKVMTLSPSVLEGRRKATWEREFKLSWREAGSPNHLDDKVDSDQYVVNKELSLSPSARGVTRLPLSLGIQPRVG